MVFGKTSYSAEMSQFSPAPSKSAADAVDTPPAATISLTTFWSLVALLLLCLFGLPLRVPVVADDHHEEALLLLNSEASSLTGTYHSEHPSFRALTFNTTSGYEPNGAGLLRLTIHEAENKMLRESVIAVADLDREQYRWLFAFPPIYEAMDRTFTYTLSLETTDEKLTVPLRAKLDQEDAPAITVYASRQLLPVLVEQWSSYDQSGEDIYYYWLRGAQLAEGTNPYSCATDNTCVNHKNPGHLPLFYYLSAWSQQLGWTDFETWFALWQGVSLTAYLSIAAVLFIIAYERRQFSLAILAVLFWLGNRWSLYVIRVGHIEFIAILFLVLALALINWRRSWVAPFFFGISLAVKQVALFLAPLWIIAAWPDRKKMLHHFLAMAAVPTIVSLPLFLHDQRAMIKSVLFAVTRTNEANMGAPSLDAVLQLEGLQSSMFMFLLVGLVYVMAARRQLPIVLSGLFIFVIMLAFNTVVFNQYFLWVIPLLPLVMSDYLHKANESKQAPDTNLVR